MMHIRNPIEEYGKAKGAALVERKDKELEMWRKWKKSGKPEHLEPLLKAYEPVFAQKMRQYRAPYSATPSTFEADLKTHFINALKTYDPSRGAALNTHVDYRLKKSMRYNTRHANLAYIPAGQTRLITPITKAHEELSEQYGRDPTPTEIATHLQANGEEDFRHITAKRVETVMKAQRRSIPSSTFESDPTKDFPGFEEQEIAVAAQTLPQIFPNKPEIHELFHYTFGTNGHQQITSTSRLAKKMGKTDQQISHMKTQMGGVLRKAMGYDSEEE